MPPRRLPNWIEGWEEYVSCAPSPHLLRKWSAISLIAGAMERKCWVRSRRRRLYPNLYVFMLAPPGVGKTFLTATIWDFWDTLNSTHHLAANSISKAALIDCLDDAKRSIVRPGEPTVSFNSLLIVANELNTLIPTYDNDFMAALTDIYDCHPYSERKRTKKTNINMRAPQINMIVCATPANLADCLPEGAWEMGFMSRCILIYSGESLISDLHIDEEDDIDDKGLKKELLADLKEIGKSYGPFTWELDAIAQIKKWHFNHGEPSPDHPKLAHYCTRRTAHLLKLCQVASINESNGKVITLDHLQIALDWLVEAEKYMPDVFKAMTHGGDAQLITECFHFAIKLSVKEGQPVRESRIINFLGERTPAHNVERILTIMEKGDLLRPVMVNKIGKCFWPKRKKD